MTNNEDVELNRGEGVDGELRKRERDRKGNMWMHRKSNDREEI